MRGWVGGVHMALVVCVCTVFDVCGGCGCVCVWGGGCTWHGWCVSALCVIYVGCVCGGGGGAHGMGGVCQHCV